MPILKSSNALIINLTLPVCVGRSDCVFRMRVRAVSRSFGFSNDPAELERCVYQNLPQMPGKTARVFAPSRKLLLCLAATAAITPEGGRRLVRPPPHNREMRKSAP
jgi:hypothetical protein